MEVTVGELMVLGSGIPHDVEELQERLFLITISWPGSTKEELHAVEPFVRSPSLSFRKRSHHGRMAVDACGRVFNFYRLVFSKSELTLVTLVTATAKPWIPNVDGSDYFPVARVNRKCLATSFVEFLTTKSEIPITSRSATDTTAHSTSGETGAPKKNCLLSIP